MRGLDLRLPNNGQSHQCGPLCGLNAVERAQAVRTLRELSPWHSSKSVAQRDALLCATRPIRLFFAGVARGAVRSALFARHANASGFWLRDTAGRHATAAAAAALLPLNTSSPTWMAHAFAASDFCLAPEGA